MTSDGTTLRAVPALAVASALLFLARPAAARVAEDPFGGMRPMDHADLGTLRGGMMIGGIPVDFAITVTTTVQGATQTPVGLQTTLAINNVGGIGSATTTTLGLPQAMAGNGISLALGGSTNLIQQVTRNQIQTLISNAANNMSVSHSTDITVTLPKFLSANQLYTSRMGVANLGFQAAMAGLGH